MSLPVTLAEAESRADECVTLLRTLVEIESPTGAEAANLEVAKVLEREMLAAGCRVERIAAPGLGVHLLGRFGPAPAGHARPLLLVGHMDTVHGLGTLQRLPFAIRGGRIYGPGSYDMKGGLATSLVATAAPCRTGKRSGRRTVPAGHVRRGTRFAGLPALD